MTKIYEENKPVLGILLGDAAGIGSELVAKLAANGFLEEHCYPLIIGDARVLEVGMKIAGKSFSYNIIEEIDDVDWEKGINLLDQKNLDPADIELGKISAVCGKASGDMLVKAIGFYKEGKIDGFCFAPLNKASMKLGGYNYESEHELFAKQFNWTEPYGEVNALGALSTTRVTSHIPIKEVSEHLTMDSIMDAIELAYKTLRRSGVENPRIGVAALNPHAGENGTCGKEEIEIIAPAIEEARKRGINIIGQYPADVLFIKAFQGAFDVVVTMYHDQGQIAMKLKGFEKGVTIAAGLPAPITTPAHGTAFDIVGQGIANTGATENALIIAAKMAINDKKALGK